jgi:hypothetical protein
MRLRNLAVGLSGILLSGSLIIPALAAPGETSTLTCETGWESVNVTRTEVTAVCAASSTTTPSSIPTSGTPTLGPTVTPSPSPSTSTPTSTPSPRPSPTATATPSTTPTPSPSPTPTPTSSPPASGSCDTIQGYGAGTTGGSRTVLADTFAEVRAGASVSGNKVVITGNAVLDGNGQSINPAANTTITREAGSTAVLWDTWILVRSSNVLLSDFVIRAGDESNGADSDPISIIAASGQNLSNIAVNRVEAVFGLDVGGITVLTNGGQLSNVTVQCSIIGHGLLRSTHPEAHDDANGHSYSFNLSGISPGSAPRNVSVWRNLILGSVGRNPRICGSDAVDLVNNVIYNFVNPPECNPKGLNYVGNVLREGPAPEAAGLNETQGIFKPSTSGDFPSLFTNSVWESGNVCEHAESFSCTRTGSSSVYRTSPYGTISVPVAPGFGLTQGLLAEVGPTTRDALTSQHIAEVQNRTGTYYNGKAGPARIAKPQ